MNLQTLKARIDRLLEDQSPPDGPPECICYLPGNNRPGPGADGPLPRVAWRSAKAACVLYDPKAGPPDASTVAGLVEGSL
jgi:hypothetical protein